MNSSQAASTDKMEWISISGNVAVSIIMQPLAADHRNIMMEKVAAPGKLEIHSILMQLPAWEDFSWL